MFHSVLLSGLCLLMNSVSSVILVLMPFMLRCMIFNLVISILVYACLCFECL